MLSGKPNHLQQDKNTRTLGWLVICGLGTISSEANVIPGQIFVSQIFTSSVSFVWILANANWQVTSATRNLSVPSSKRPQNSGTKATSLK